LSDICSKDGKAHDWQPIKDLQGNPKTWRMPRPRNKLLGTQTTSLLTRERCTKCGNYRTREISRQMDETIEVKPDGDQNT
jgi:hypothetical protein